MPGVNVTTAVRSGPVGAGDIVAGQVFMVGEAERGPTAEPTLLRSFGDYTTYYGNYKSTNLYAHVKTYFDEGGTRCHVQRVVGSGAAAALLVHGHQTLRLLFLLLIQQATDFSSH